MADGIGLSVGATNLMAVVVDRAAVKRTAVLTLFPHRPPEVGLPSENPNLAGERGLIINDFVDRVGDPVDIVAPDGSSHRAEVLLADALRAMLYAVTRGQPPAGPVAVAHPAHWQPPAVAALRGALAAMPEFASGGSAPLVPDAVAALTALQHDPGVPSRGVIAVCDFGGTGTSVTLADAAHGFAPLAPTLRYADLSGDLIDQALLTRVIAGLSEAGSIDLSGTSAIGSLTRLRAQCRAAKERLSTTAVTSLTAELPGHRDEVRVTRTELDDAIRQPLAGFMDELQDTLQRSGIRPEDLVAVASVGGGARMPIITTTLSEHLRVPVITNAQPELAASIGSGLKAARGTVEEGATSMAALPAAPEETGPPPASGPVGALAWSDAQDVPDVLPAADYDDVATDGPGPFGADARPRIDFAEADEPDHGQAAPVPWYRRPFVILAAGIVLVLAAIAAAVMLVNRDDEPAPAPTTTSSTPAPPPTTTEVLPPPATTPAQSPASETRTVVPAPPPRVTVTEEPPPPPPATSEPPPPPPPPPPTTTEPPPPPPTETSPPPLIPTLPYETIPGLPFVPAPVQPPPP